jgi:hypothetical protein
LTTLLFLPRFHDAIRSGTKRQTIRRPRLYPIRPGDLLSLRGWSGAPYRSPQVVLRDVVCASVEPIAIGLDDTLSPSIDVARIEVPPDRLDEFARADGFAAFADFEAHWSSKRSWFGVFEGVLIRWEAHHA